MFTDDKDGIFEVGEKFIWWPGTRIKKWADGNAIHAPALITIVGTHWKPGTVWVRFEANKRVSTVQTRELVTVESFKWDCENDKRLDGNPLCALTKGL